eukprot:jgi/Chlat1/2125/Chrsp17S02715
MAAQENSHTETAAVPATDDRVIAIASDHGGYELKQILAKDLADKGYKVMDLGCHSPDSVDYPIIANTMVEALKVMGEVGRGVLCCGTGIGISIAANRHAHVRCALVHSVDTARLCRQHNDANVIALGGRVLDPAIALECLHAFLDTDFEGGRHQRRVAMLGS